MGSFLTYFFSFPFPLQKGMQFFFHDAKSYPGVILGKGILEEIPTVLNIPYER